MKRFFLILLLSFNLSGCSFLNMATAPFRTAKKVVPEQTKTAQNVTKCRGEIQWDQAGKIVSCTKGFYAKDYSFNQEERKWNWRERIAHYILNLKGYLLLAIIASVVLSCTGFGWVVSGFWSGVRGTGRALGELVKGVNRGKKYIRQNGSSYTGKEKEAYQKGLDDMMKEISGSLKTESSKKIVNKIRAESE